MMNSSKTENFEIHLKEVGKKFNKQWIFSNLNLLLKSGDRLEVQGSNGSGKSTFLQIISGFITPNSGTINWTNNGSEITPDTIFRDIALAAPYVDLIEEFTLIENVEFYTRMKPFQNNISIKHFLEISELNSAQNNYIKNYSSGMKQRLKLALAILSDTAIILLDEPLSNLDTKGYKWYHNLCEQYIKNRILVVCSNKVKEETALCNREINIELHKPSSFNN